MTDPKPHILTQIRRAFTTLLEGLFTEDRVYPYSALETGFQPDQFPLAIVLVTDVKTTNVEEGIDTRDVTVSIKLAERASVKRPDERVDEMLLALEKQLANRGDLGFGKYSNWQVGSIGTPNFEPMNDADPAMVFAALLPVSFTVRTHTADPSRNVNP